MATSPSASRVNYPLLSDRTQQVSAVYGVLDENEGYAYRATFIIDPEGKIQSFLVNPQSVGRNVDETLRLITALQFAERTGLAVPAMWKPGDPGIKRAWDAVGKY